MRDVYPEPDGIFVFGDGARCAFATRYWLCDGTHVRTELIPAALNMLITQRWPSAVIHHSDQNCHYTRYAFGKRCREAGVISSMGLLGDAYDNAMAESFMPRAQELPNSRRFKNKDGGV